MFMYCDFASKTLGNLCSRRKAGLNPRQAMAQCQQLHSGESHFVVMFIQSGNMRQSRGDFNVIKRDTAVMPVQ